MATFTMTYPEALEAEPGIERVALTEYPIFDESYREYLNKTIADHFHNREIGMETASMFELALRRKMNLIMPFYNEHYRTSLRAAGVDPLQTMKINSRGKNTGNTTSSGESNSDSTGKAVSRAVGSEFPQTQLSDSGDYATSAQDNISDTVSNGAAREKNNTTQDGETENNVTGSQGQTSMLLFQHRQTLVNVDLMVLTELEELFMSVWSTGDEFTPRLGMGSFGYFGHTGIW